MGDSGEDLANDCDATEASEKSVEDLMDVDTEFALDAESVLSQYAALQVQVKEMMEKYPVKVDQIISRGDLGDLQNDAEKYKKGFNVLGLISSGINKHIYGLCALVQENAKFNDKCMEKLSKKHKD